MDSVLEVSDVSFSYAKPPVLRDVSMRVRSGECLGIIGPNGSGKTTLLRILLGLEQPDSGHVRLFDTPISDFDAGERIGYVAQDAAHVDRSIPITVREFVRMGRFPHVGLNDLDESDETLVDEALETVGIQDLANRRIGTLSGGQKQRGSIARALASEADLLVLDEPTVGVDATARERFYDLLRTLNRNGITIILIDHDLEQVLDIAERIVVLNETILLDAKSGAVSREDLLAAMFTESEVL